MKLKDFFILADCATGLQEQISRLQRPSKVRGVSVPETLNELSIGELLRLQGIQTDDDAIFIPCEVILDLTREEVMKAEASEVLGFVVWVSKEVERINKLFERTKVPPTKEEKAAGVDELNFGAFGILDWYARRMGIIDHEYAGYTKWAVIYKCLEMDAKQTMYERRLRDVYNNKK